MKVLVYPIDSNPYEDLLFTQNKIKYHIKYVKLISKSKTIGLILLYFQLAYLRFYGYEIFHLQWINFNFPYTNNIIIRILSSLNTITTLIWIIILKYKIVFTVHNITPHEKELIHDAFFTKIVFILSRSIIVHSKSTYDQINTIHDINPNKINLIPMGNYNLYRKFCSNCRLKDINNKHFKIIFFGKIRKYKGLEELILVFNKVRLKLYNIILVISGECADLKYRHILTNLVDNESIFFNFQSISDMDLHLFFHNSDVVALPFREITSTSSAFIACAFNKPIIAPRMGNLCDFPVNTGFFYDPEDPHGLENALIRAYRERKRCPEYGQNAYRYSQTLSWEDAAAKTMKVYRNVLKM